ncbi:hypothetical protein SLA2020_004600 [Shorea laevis]
MPFIRRSSHSNSSSHTGRPPLTPASLPISLLHRQPYLSLAPLNPWVSFDSRPDLCVGRALSSLSMIRHMERRSCD